MAKSDATKNVTYKINLKELFGESFADKQTLKKRIGEEVIARIQNRTQRGIDKKGKTFTGYRTPELKKRKGNPPDLTQTEKMLGALFVKQNKQPNILAISLKTAKQRLKAENHIHGVTLPKRDFLGLPQGEIKSVKKEFKDDV